MRRAKSYDEDLSEKLQKKEFAKSFLQGLMENEDGWSAEDALRYVIRKMGIKEFSLAAGVPAPNVQEFLTGKRKPKPETLDIYLKPFGLRTKIILEEVA